MNCKLNEIQARSFSRVCGLLVAIEQLEKPDLHDLVNKTDIPRRSILGIFDRLEREYQVVIERINGRRHGYYEVADWGMLNRDRILQSQGEYPQRSPEGFEK
jgi:hypothetical protein